MKLDGRLLVYRLEKTIKPLADGLHRQFASNLAGLISSHTISDDKETTISIFRRFDTLIDTIFVLLSLFPDISFISSSQFYMHRYVPHGTRNPLSIFNAHYSI